MLIFAASRAPFYMTDLLLDIDLRQLPDDYLTGDWQVVSRVLNRNPPDTVLAQATRLLLSHSELRAFVPGTEDNPTGRWSVLRDELLNRPYLRFDLPTEEARALVTRLRRSANGRRSQLSLYFASGMEMELSLLVVD